MKLVLYSIIALIAAATLAGYAMEDPGYIMISFRDTTIETSVIVFASAALLGFLALYFIFRLLVNTGLLPRRIKSWRKHRKIDLGRKNLTRGILALNRGHFYEAEMLLVKSARDEDLAVLAYIGASRAAQAQGAKERSNGYLEHARAIAPKETTSLSITQARLQAEHGNTDEAIKTLCQLPSSEHGDPYVLKLMADYYTELKDWTGLVEILPRLQRNKALAHDVYADTEHLAYSGLLNQAAQRKDVKALWSAWETMPKEQRNKEDIIVDFTCSLINCGRSDEAEEVLYHHLSKKWNDALVYIYGLLDGDAEIHLNRGRNWLTKQKDNPALLLSLGRLAMRAHLWKDARTYLEDSLSIAPNGETYQELGNLLTFLNEEPQALECFRRGLSLSANTLINPELKSGPVERAQLPRAKSAFEDSNFAPQLAASQSTPSLT